MLSIGEHLAGRRIDPNRAGVTVGEVRDAGDALLVTVRWDNIPNVPAATTWLRCSERDPDLVRQLVLKWINGEWDDPRISDVEPPEDAVCGGWLSPDGRHWRASEITHRIVATRIVRNLRLPIGCTDPEHWLLTHGWIHILDGGQCFNEHLDAPTQAQRDKLFDLAMRHPTMREQIMDCVRAYKDG